MEKEGMESPESDGLPNAVGFIGLGAMGKPMVLNLGSKLPQGASIYVYDVVSSLVHELHTSLPDKVVMCTGVKEVTERSDVIITMLPEGQNVKAVYLDTDTGILAGLVQAASTDPKGQGKLLIDSSTIDTSTSLHVKDQLAKTFPTISFYDAPVSGGVLGAEKGTMAFFLGSAPTDPNVPRITNLLRTMGGKVIPCGGPSLGLSAKLANNYLSGVITIACAEAMDMGMRAGLDPSVLASVFAAGTAQNTICDVFNPVPGVCPESPPSRGYRGGFRVQLMRKDVGLALGMARTVGARNALGTAALGIYAAASDAPDCRDLDSRIVYRYLGGSEDMSWKHVD